jgi:hypothetical protein
LKRAGARVDPSQSSVLNVPPAVEEVAPLHFVVSLKDTEGQPLVKYQRGFTVEAETPAGVEKVVKFR